uniref:RING-type domain-containing protein n=1 Tax=Clastoptera arizonana TaxID=38151 RepID=A0A1B6E225_9HEMI
MEQFEQLLTCAICLDRYRNPKLLPCQHSFCMEPCMDGLVDYVRRQVKCPECRAEHRIPYQGVQGYPTNVTLQRFLELHIEITGELPDPTSGQIMKRCNVCSEKAYCTHCVHCDKEICPDCKGAHMDILRREISRINNQIRRALHRLQDMLAVVEKNMLSLQTNCTSVSEEVDEIYRRLTKALKDRTEFLRTEIERYSGTEMRNLTTLKDNLEMEISNITSNCDLADKHMQGEDIEWDDCELMDAKEIFLKTVDFIRNFESDAVDHNRKVRFVMAHDPNQLVLHVAGYGDLIMNMPHQPFATGSGGTQSGLQPPGPGLMRSKSDHRLASQYRQQEERGYDRGYEGGEGRASSPLQGRKFGEGRRTTGGGDRYEGRYGRTDRDYGDFDSGYDEGRPSARSRIRSRFRHGQGDNDSDNEHTGSKSVRFSETGNKERERVLDTEDVAKGPLSGITRLYDSPRVMKRLQDSTTKKDKPEPPPPQPVKNTFQPPKKQTSNLAQRQVSEEDEITKIKRLMKNAPGEPAVVEPQRPAAERVSALKRSGAGSEEEREDRQQQSSPTSSRSTPSSEHSRKTPAQEVASSDAESDDNSLSSRQRAQRKPATPTTTTATRTSSASSEATTTAGTRSSAGAGNTPTTQTAPQTTVATKDDDEESETETSSESEETESSEESESEEKKTPVKSSTPKSAMEKTDIGPLLARSAQAREGSVSSGSNTRKNSRDEGYSSSTYKSPYSTKEDTTSNSSYFGRTRATAPEPEPEHTNSRYSGGFTSRFLNKSKSSAAVSPEEEEPQRKFSNAGKEEESAYPSTRSRFAALRDRKKTLARSKSTHNFGGDEDDDTEDTTTSPSAYLASKYGTTGNDLSRSRSTHVMKSRENSPDRTTATGSSGEKDGAALSSWARYLKNKYGNRGKDGKETSSSTNSRRLSLGLPLRSNTLESSDDDQKNMSGSPNSPTQAIATPVGFAAVGTRQQYLQKRRQLFKIGSRGSEPGCFTWPRGVAVGPDNSIVVADSSNHRVQVFDCDGNYQKEFGTYGNAEGEFDCLAGVAVNRIGQFIIADRYNHRIQVMDPSGRYLRSFGSQGTSDGRFNYPWGITTDALGFIYVCDKENHRVQVFQSDGTFVGKFGSQGHKVGQLDHPHYIAVSNTNRVIVSDSNNHRIQIFDVNGQVLSSIGSEGSENGQFKFPRGVAVDDQGYIFVGDSGNNRIQIFQPDGQFLRAFGCWGAGDSEFKGLEGVAVMSNGNILVCDRENHRIQVF